MTKIFILFSLLSTLLLAQEGEAVYKAKCASCHQMQGAMHDKSMRAPHMKMVSMRLKSMTKDRASFIAFVKDYIQNPSKKKGFCMPMAYKRFGTMPPIGKALSAKERKAVAAWLYDAFDGKWEKSKQGMMCERKNNSKAMMKCGSGKCGGGKCGGAR